MRNTDVGRGWRSGYRVIYYPADRNDVLLVSVYSKAEQYDIDADEIRQIIDVEERR